MRSRALATTVLIAALLATLPANAASGFYYEARTTVTAEGKKPDVTSVFCWIAGGRARIEFVDGPKKGMFAQGSYLLTEDGGRTMKLVDTKEETWSEIDVEAMLNLATTMLASMGDTSMITFEDAHAAKLLDEPGDELLGRATTHKRWQSGMTMKTNVIGIKTERRVELLQDLWFTTEVHDPGFRAWLRPANFRTGNPELDEMMQAEFDTMEGFPLRSVTVSTSTTKKGKQDSSTSETVVTELREEDVKDERFTVPSHYEHKPIMPTEEQMRAAQTDAAMQDAEQDPAAAGDEDQGNALKNAKKKLTGFFKKKNKKKDD